MFSLGDRELRSWSWGNYQEFSCKLKTVNRFQKWVANSKPLTPRYKRGGYGIFQSTNYHIFKTLLEIYFISSTSNAPCSKALSNCSVTCWLVATCSFNCLVIASCFSISATIRVCSERGGRGINATWPSCVPSLGIFIPFVTLFTYIKKSALFNEYIK